MPWSNEPPRILSRRPCVRLHNDVMPNRPPGAQCNIPQNPENDAGLGILGFVPTRNTPFSFLRHFLGGQGRENAPTVEICVRHSIDKCQVTAQTTAHGQAVRPHAATTSTPSRHFPTPSQGYNSGLSGKGGEPTCTDQDWRSRGAELAARWCPEQQISLPQCSALARKITEA